MRKGVVLAQVMAGALMLAGLIILLLFVAKVGNTTSKLVEDSECSNSIIAHSNLIKASGGSSLQDVKCPTKYYTSVASEEAGVKKDVADALKSCWGMWGRGELVLFDEPNIYCHVCTVIDFKKKDLKVSGFSKYLSENQVPDSKFAGMTYAQYLSYYSTDEPPENVRNAITSLSGENSIDTSKKYAAMFMYAKGKDNVEAVLKAISGVESAPVGGLVAGGVLGGTAAVAGTFILVSNPAGWTVLAVGAVGAAVGGAVLGIMAWVRGSSPEFMAMTLLTEYSPEGLARLNCKATPVLQDNEKARLG